RGESGQDRCYRSGKALLRINSGLGLGLAARSGRRCLLGAEFRGLVVVDIHIEPHIEAAVPFSAAVSFVGSRARATVTRFLGSSRLFRKLAKQHSGDGGAQRLVARALAVDLHELSGSRSKPEQPRSLFRGDRLAPWF